MANASSRSSSDWRWARSPARSSPIGEPARAYARLRELANTLPALEDYRRFWMARALEDMRETDGAVAAYQDFLLANENPLLKRSARQRCLGAYQADRGSGRVRGSTISERRNGTVNSTPSRPPIPAIAHTHA